VSEIVLGPKRTYTPGGAKIVSTSQEVEVMVSGNRWRSVAPGGSEADMGAKPSGKCSLKRHPEGTEVEGEVSKKNIHRFGLFVGLPGDTTVWFHLSEPELGPATAKKAIQDYRKVTRFSALVSEVEFEKNASAVDQGCGGDKFRRSQWGGVKRGSVVTVFRDLHRRRWHRKSNTRY